MILIPSSHPSYHWCYLFHLHTSLEIHIHVLYNACLYISRASWLAQIVKNLSAMWEIWVQSLGQEDPLENGMVIHVSILAWRIPQIEEPGGLQSMGSKRVGQDWATKTFTFHAKVYTICTYIYISIYNQIHCCYYYCYYYFCYSNYCYNYYCYYYFVQIVFIG